MVRNNYQSDASKEVIILILLNISILINMIIIINEDFASWLNTYLSTYLKSYFSGKIKCNVLHFFVKSLGRINL